MIAHILIGLIAGIGLILLGRLSGMDRERSFYPTLLGAIATYYILFAAMSESWGAALMEAGIALLFLGLAVLGFVRNLWFTVAGLIGHGVFDGFHHGFFNYEGVPAWWPGLCLAVDGLLGLYLAWLLASGSLSTRPQ